MPRKRRKVVKKKRHGSIADIVSPGIVVTPPPPLTYTIANIVVAAYDAGNPTDDVLIRICADDAGGSIPGTELGTATCDSNHELAWPSSPGIPSPTITFDPDDIFWIVFDRTGPYSNTDCYATIIGSSPVESGYHWYDGSWHYSPGGNGSAIRIEWTSGAIYPTIGDGGVHGGFGMTGVGYGQKLAYKMSLTT